MCPEWKSNVKEQSDWQVLRGSMSERFYVGPSGTFISFISVQKEKNLAISSTALFEKL